MRSTRWICAALLAGLAGACDGETGPDNERFTAAMTGAKEIPNAIATPATGTAEFEVEDDGTVSYRLDVSGITGVTMAHIHGPANAAANAGVRVWLHPVGATAPGAPSGPVSGTLAQGSFAASQIVGMTMDSLLVLLRGGNAYVNVHTSANGAGEIRGQITPR